MFKKKNVQEEFISVPDPVKPTEVEEQIVSYLKLKTIPCPTGDLKVQFTSRYDSFKKEEKPQRQLVISKGVPEGTRAFGSIYYFDISLNDKKTLSALIDALQEMKCYFNN